MQKEIKNLSMQTPKMLATKKVRKQASKLLEWLQLKKYWRNKECETNQETEEEINQASNLQECL